MELNEQESEVSESEIETLMGAISDDPVPDPAPDLVSRTLRRVRGMVLLRDLVGFATVEALWESLIRRRKAAERDEDHPDQ